MLDFIKGALEFRCAICSSPDNLLAYEWGREIMHLLTFRKWDY